MCWEGELVYRGAPVLPQGLQNVAREVMLQLRRHECFLHVCRVMHTYRFFLRRAQELWRGHQEVKAVCEAAAA
eukprot:jgi/Botrbrau1/7235/Bobra.0021s0019.1